jgi:hypothetical protein
MSGGKDLLRNLVECLSRHFDKRLTTWGGKHRSLCRAGEVTLDKYVAVIRDDGSRAGTPSAQLRHRAVFTNDFLDFHFLLLFLLFLVNQNCAKWVKLFVEGRRV